MQNRVLDFGQEARTKLISGINELVKAVAVTLGPKGRNVLITDSIGVQHVTKDGVTVARAIRFKDKLKDAGVQLVKQASAQSNEQAGDGTTTATVLAGEMINQGHKLIVGGAAPIDLQRGMVNAAEIIYSSLKYQSSPVTTQEQIRRIATISTNGDEFLGNTIAELMDKVGIDGAVKVEESINSETSIQVVEGLEFNRGYLSPYFAPSGAFEGTDVSVLLMDCSLDTVPEVQGILEDAAKSKKQIVILAHDFNPQVINFFAHNVAKGILNACLVKAPSFGINRTYELNDIAVLTGATVYSKAIHKPSDLKVDLLGTIKNLNVTAKKTLIVGGGGTTEAIDKYVADIKANIDAMEKANEELKEYDLELLRTRYSKLNNGVGIIRVGGSTEIEIKERRDRVDDAIAATRAASEEGVVVGGGTALLNASIELKSYDTSKFANDDVRAGFNLVIAAITKPLISISENAGENGDVTINNIITQRTKDVEPNLNFGYDAYTGKYVDLVETGVIDPVKVTRLAVKHAVSVAGIVLTTEATVTDDPEDLAASVNPNMTF
ncbi:60 kDa chaperonin [Habropoda laboriosa]|uniref:60 kDa chaperonin n=1 Tax=Habropoda laboriosa TaxID=597456 RepID=A0A0L7QIS8_9HYME|nr:PREDICTED: 60 kDa chaperonin-like [Habropoda laboriosa]KOC58547.1 60 kDa chaperonin [Habropoda laboriosa]